MRDCAVCIYLCLDPRGASGTVGVNTSIAELVESAVQRLDGSGNEVAHVLVAVCPEHVVDIYRDRLDGVSMAWRLALAGT
jgi:hypothetical protein